MRLQTWAFAALAVLVAFQALYALLVPQPVPGFGDALVLVCDAVLVAVFFAGTLKERREASRRNERVRESLAAILDLAEEQQRHWHSTISTISVEPEDRVEGLQKLLSARNKVSRPVPEAERRVEVLVDAIQTMLLLNDSLMTDFDDVLGFYRRTYEELHVLRSRSRLQQFLLGTSVDFLSQMGAETNRYSERLVLEMLASFEEITRFSQGIGTDVSGKIHKLMDAANAEGLHAVNRESSVIQTELDRFFGDLAEVRSKTEASIRENLVQMQRIQTIAEGIAGFSESIRMISLNLNIEAARGHQGSGSGKAVQVLATKLSEFAVKAQELAGQQQDVIGTASRVLSEAGDHQRAQLAALMAAVAPIKGHLDPFARIVGATFARFGEVDATMDQLSAAIESKLQGVIGKFQFQDLVRQEQEHILALFAFVRRQSEADGEVGALPESKKREARNELLDTFERMASTENEHNVLRAYRELHPGASKPDAKPEISAGMVELF